MIIIIILNLFATQNVILSWEELKGSWAEVWNWIKGFLYCIHTIEVYILVANFVGGRTNINSLKVVFLLLLANGVILLHYILLNKHVKLGIWCLEYDRSTKEFICLTICIICLKPLTPIDSFR